MSIIEVIDRGFRTRVHLGQYEADPDSPTGTSIRIADIGRRAYDFIVVSQPKGLFGTNGTVPLRGRFRCENNLLSVLKWKEKGHLYRKRNGTVVSKQALSRFPADDLKVFT